MLKGGGVWHAHSTPMHERHRSAVEPPKCPPDASQARRTQAKIWGSKGWGMGDMGGIAATQTYRAQIKPASNFESKML